MDASIDYLALLDLFRLKYVINERVVTCSVYIIDVHHNNIPLIVIFTIYISI